MKLFFLVPTSVLLDSSIEYPQHMFCLGNDKKYRDNKFILERGCPLNDDE